MTVLTRACVRALADRLTVEYAGALPPGQVLALVYRADRSLRSIGDLPGDLQLQVCEQVVRGLLTERLAVGPRSLAG